MAFGDAIAWIDEAPELLALIPPRWISDVHASHASNVAQHRADRDTHGIWCQFEACIQIGATCGTGAKAIGAPHILWTDGEIAFHTDEEFPPFTALLIVEDAGRRACGTVRGPDRAQPRGALIGLHAHRPHALLQSDIDYDWAKRTGGSFYYDEAPEHPWIALGCDYPKLMGPKAVRDDLRLQLRAFADLTQAALMEDV